MGTTPDPVTDPNTATVEGVNGQVTIIEGDNRKAKEEDDKRWKEIIGITEKLELKAAAGSEKAKEHLKMVNVYARNRRMK